VTTWSCVLELQQCRKVMITKHVATNIPPTVAPTTIATRVLCAELCLCCRVDVLLSADAGSLFCCPKSKPRFIGISSQRGVPSNVNSAKPDRQLQSEMCLLPIDELACHVQFVHAVAPRLAAYWAGGQGEHGAAPAPDAYVPGSPSATHACSRTEFQRSPHPSCLAGQGNGQADPYLNSQECMGVSKNWDTPYRNGP
jgi:hypothetical protein